MDALGLYVSHRITRTPLLTEGKNTRGNVRVSRIILNKEKESRVDNNCLFLHKVDVSAHRMKSTQNTNSEQKITKDK